MSARNVEKPYRVLLAGSTVVAGIALSLLVGVTSSKASEWEFRGMCNASAVELLNDTTIVVANDEDNILRTYDLEGNGNPIGELDLDVFLKADGEVDFEASTSVGGTIYYITSHGRNKKGNRKLDRYRFLATQIDPSSDTPTLHAVDTPYLALVEDMIASSELQALDIASVSRLEEEKMKDLAPKKAGLNIEGMSRSRDGKALYIGLRNPTQKGRAVIVVLENPADIVSGSQTAKFAKPIYIDLNGLGIRSMTFVDERDAFYIVAGSGKSKVDHSVLYTWDGAGGPVAIKGPLQGNPEAMAYLPNKKQLLILSDDGAIEEQGQECKDHPETSKKFRGYVVDI
ncbi:Uncharacterised protein [Halioglobus japonicus]|nr:Uncharacterised protein [Halioglobus japonicus]